MYAKKSKNLKHDLKMYYRFKKENTISTTSKYGRIILFLGLVNVFVNITPNSKITKDLH